MAIVVEVLTPVSAVTQATNAAVAITVVKTADSTIVNNAGQAVVEVVGANMVTGVVVSATPPINPYEGQVWLDIS